MALGDYDAFDQYGTGATGKTNMLQGVYAEIGPGCSPNATNPATGANALRYDTSTTAWRRVLKRVNQTKVGHQGRFFFSILPAQNNRLVPLDFRDGANAKQVSIVIQSTGAIAAFRGSVDSSPVLLGTSAGPAVVAGAYQHIAAQVVFSNTVGTVEVRVNGNTVLNLTGQDTVSSANVECSQVGGMVGSAGLSPGVTVDMDDWASWDGSGSSDTDFPGDLKVFYEPPISDGALQDWNLTSGSSTYALIDEVPPNGDADYIFTDTATKKVSVGFSSLPVNVSSVRAVMPFVMARKTDAGPCDLKLGMISGATTDEAAAHSMTTAYTYYWDIWTTDPATGAAWTPAAVNAALAQIDRTA